MFITFLQMGLANGVQPLLGYNYGSGDHKRFVSVERYTKKCCVIVGILATALFFVLREPIIRLFISDGEVVYYGVKMLIAYMLSGPVINPKEQGKSDMACCSSMAAHIFSRHSRSYAKGGLGQIPWLMTGSSHTS